MYKANYSFFKKNNSSHGLTYLHIYTNKTHQSHRKMSVFCRKIFDLIFFFRSENCYISMLNSCSLSNMSVSWKEQRSQETEHTEAYQPRWESTHLHPTLNPFGSSSACSRRFFCVWRWPVLGHSSFLKAWIGVHFNKSVQFSTVIPKPRFQHN